MAIHFAPQGGSRWGNLGESIATGLNQGVDAYIDKKKQQRALADRMKALQSFGFSPQDAQALAPMDDRMIMGFLKEKQSAREREALGGARGQLFGAQGQQQGMPMEQPRGPMGQPQQPNLMSESNGLAAMPEGLSRPPVADQQEPGSLTDRLMGLDTRGLNPRDYDKLFQEATAIDNLALKKEAIGKREAAPQRALVSKRVDEHDRRVEKAERRISDYEQLKDLAKSGKLHSGSLRKFADTIGFPKTWQGSASEVGTKLLANLNFERMLSSVPGGRATAKLLEEIQKTNPNIYQEPKSIAVLSELMINQEKEDQMLNDEVHKLVDKNKGLTPLNVFKEAEKNIKPQIKALHEKSKSLLDRAYGLNAEKKGESKATEVKAGSIVKQLSGIPSGSLVQDEDTGEYLVIEANGKERKATPQDLAKHGVK